jgi:acyl-CoA reductase-like NAD-dependent aldehyde dehydrogenase
MTTTTAQPVTNAAGIERLEQHFIDGRTVTGTGDRELRRVSPVDGRPSTVLRPAGQLEVDAAITSAVGAAAAWRRLSPADRATALRLAAAAVRERADELGAVLCADTGRLLASSIESAGVAAELLDEAAAAATGPQGRALAGSSAALDLVRRVPHGVVAVITPWNDPFPAAAGLLAAALVTGNVVVHKPSERCPRAGWELGRLIAEALPTGVLQVLLGDGDTGARIVADDRVALVAQVGSTATGRAVAAAAGARGARVLRENGGKDAIIVDAGVDPTWAAEQIALGAFTNTGQLCTSVERVYLHEAVADPVVEALVAITRATTVADPSDAASQLGPLVDEEQLAVVARHVEAAVEAGARCLVGGARLDRPGAWYPPTVLEGCTGEMEVMTEETFGPVAAIVRVADFDAALTAAGSGRYGLAATVLTPRLDHALRAVDELEVGTVKINGVFGGAPGGSAEPRRDSGSGVGYGPDLLAAMTLLKAVHIEAGHTGSERQPGSERHPAAERPPA